MTAVFAVKELQRAARALVAGEFANPAAAEAARSAPQATVPWWPTEHLITVIGAAPQVGTTTVALAIAAATPASTRLVEAALPAASGLAGATDAELGVTESGWRRARRGELLVERCFDAIDGQLPAPEPTTRPLTVLDAGCRVPRSSWISQGLAASARIVVVGQPTVPGLAALEATLIDLVDHEVVLALVGPPIKRWPKLARASIGALTAVRLQQDHVIVVPVSRSLHLRGLTTASLPTPLVLALSPLVHLEPEGHSS